MSNRLRKKARARGAATSEANRGGGLEQTPEEAPAGAKDSHPRVSQQPASRIETHGRPSSDTDRIERSIVLRAPRERVWRALASAEEFGVWFGVNLAGQRFEPGKRARGPITHPGYEHIWFDALVERVEPNRLLSFRWHPYAVDAAVDYSAEQPTLVTFTLADADSAGEGTLLTVVESGFDSVPAHRRLEAFRMNTQGWEIQVRNVARHVDAHP